jgi:hypothetical protein
MSIIKSTGLYGDAYLFEDVETLKILSTEHDTRIDILEPDNTSSKSRLGLLETDNTTNKTNITDNTSSISTLEGDNTTNKTNITGNTSRITTLEGDNTTNKTNISTHTTQIESLQLYDTSFNLRLQTLEGTEGSPGDLNLGIPAIPSTGLIAMAGSIALATAACIGVNGVSALALIDAVDAKVDSNNTSLNLKNLLNAEHFANNTTSSKIDILSTYKHPVALVAESITPLNLLSSLNEAQFANNETTSKLEILSTYKHPLAGTADTANGITPLNLLSSLDTAQFSNNATTSKLQVLSTYKHPVAGTADTANGITSLNLLSSLDTTQFSNNATTSKLQVLSTYKHPVAGTADKLANIRTIAGTDFDGTGNIDISYNNLRNKLTAGNGITIDMTVNPPTISATAGTNYWTKDATTNIYLNQTGNVGIGTTPTTKLHVYEDTTNETKLIIQNKYVTGSVSGTITATPTTTGTTGIYTYMVFTYTTETGGANTRQTLYTLNVAAGGVVCDILMVGGGGAGGKDLGGGGGGGAVLYGTNINIPADTYQIRVGDGAIMGETIGKSTSGFGATLLGGGCASNTGWGSTVANGNSGGSGAGGKPVAAGTTIGLGGSVGVLSTKGTILTTATLYDGNSGSNGNQQNNSTYAVAGGGGGGSTQTGGVINAGSNNKAGKGGDGISINITGTSLWWGAGGGGSGYVFLGGDGGKGGGGAGGATYSGATAGTAGDSGYTLASGKNAGSGTGSGGGGATFTDFTGGSGGSGIIIIRYLSPTSSSSLELVRGTTIDGVVDYSVGNYDGSFKVKSVDAGTPTDRLTISSAGNVGIGTAVHGTYKLDVNGTINATGFTLNDTAFTGGTNGTNGKGWTGATYSSTTGIVSFASSDGAPYVFDTGDLRGGKGDKGDKGDDGDNGTNGKGWTSGSYNATTGIVSFASNDAGYAFTTEDLRGASGATITSTQLSALMNTTDHFTLNGTKIDFKTTYKIPTAVLADTANGLSGTPSISVSSITASGLITATQTTAGTNDILNMRYDARNGIRFTQRYIGVDDVRYDLIQKVANVDKTASLTFYNGNVGIGRTDPTNIFQVGSGNKLRIANNNTDFTMIGTGESPEYHTRIILYGVNATDPTTSGTTGTANILYLSGNGGGHMFFNQTLSTITERMRIGNNGNVAIGTTDTATYKLNVNGSINATSILVGGSTITPSKWTIASTATDIYYNTGNVGIGVTNPQSTSKLQVQGNMWVENQLVFNNSYKGGGGTDYACNKIALYGGLNTPTTTANNGFGIADAGVEYFSGSSHIFYTGTSGGTGYGTERMRITTNGNVGIGAVNPGLYKLFITGNTFSNGTLGFNADYNGSGANYACNKLNLWNASGASQYGIGISAGTLDYFSNYNHKWWSGTQEGAVNNGFGNLRMTLYGDGKLQVAGFLGVGAYPANYQLDIPNNGTGETGNLGLRYFNYDTQIQASTTYLTNVSARIGGAIWCGSWIASSSDNRIKEDITDINDDTALNMILAIKPKTYKYIDKVAKGHKKVYGFIAQQIKEVLPDAVSIQRDYIPNIMLLADYDNEIITLPSQPTNVIIKLNDKIRCYDKDNQCINVEVIEIIDELTFKITHDHNRNNSIDLSQEELMTPTPNPFVYTDNKIFVSGTEVDDFHTISKEYIFTLNVCATQELHRRIISQEERIKELETKITQILNNI